MDSSSATPAAATPDVAPTADSTVRSPPDDQMWLRKLLASLPPPEIKQPAAIWTRARKAIANLKDIDIPIDLEEAGLLPVTVSHIELCAKAYVKQADGLVSKKTAKGRSGFSLPDRVAPHTPMWQRLELLEKSPHLKLFVVAVFAVYMIDHAAKAASNALDAESSYEEYHQISISENRDWSWDERENEVCDYNIADIECAIQDLDVEELLQASDDAAELEC